MNRKVSVKNTDAKGAKEKHLNAKLAKGAKESKDILKNLCELRFLRCLGVDIFSYAMLVQTIVSRNHG